MDTHLRAALTGLVALGLLVVALGEEASAGPLNTKLVGSAWLPPIAEDAPYWNDRIVPLDAARVLYSGVNSNEIQILAIEGDVPARIDRTGWAYYIPLPERDEFLFAARTSDLMGLFVRPFIGGSALPLDVPSLPLQPAIAVVTPDRARILIDTGETGLFVVPLDGGVATRLEVPTPPAPRVGFFRISPDGRWLAAYWNREDDWGDPVDGGLYSAPLDGGPSVVLDRASERSFTHTLFSADSSLQVYKRDGDAVFRDELYAVSTAGGPTRRLNAALPPNSHVLDYKLTADDGWVIYSVYSQPEAGGRIDLFSVPLSGGAAVQLGLPAEDSIFSWRLQIDSVAGSVFFAQVVAGRDGLFVVPVEGGEPRALIPALPPGKRIDELVLSPDGARLVYVVEGRIFALRSDGGVVTELGPELDDSCFSFGCGRSAFSPGSTHVVYPGRAEGSDAIELFAAGLDGGSAFRLNGELSPGAKVSSFALMPGGRHVIYAADQDGMAGGLPQLYSSRMPSPIRIAVLHARRNARSVRIALLGSEAVDVTTTEFSSLVLSPAGTAPAKAPHYRDVNHDGFENLVLRFRSNLRLAPSASQVCLDGMHDGFAFRSCAPLESARPAAQ